MRDAIKLTAVLAIVSVVLTCIDIGVDGGQVGSRAIVLELLEHAILVSTMAFVAWCAAAYYTIQASDRLD